MYCMIREDIDTHICTYPVMYLYILFVLIDGTGEIVIVEITKPEIRPQGIYNLTPGVVHLYLGALPPKFENNQKVIVAVRNIISE